MSMYRFLLKKKMMTRKSYSWRQWMCPWELLISQSALSTLPSSKIMVNNLTRITRIHIHEFIFTTTRLCILLSSFPASSIFSFLQPAYTYSRQDGVANIPVSREIIEDGRTQVTYRTRDLTAKDKLVSSYSGISLYPTKNV